MCKRLSTDKNEASLGCGKIKGKTGKINASTGCVRETQKVELTPAWDVC